MKKFNGGFTIIELVTVLIILSILSTLAIPNFSSFIRKQKVNTATNDISDLFNNARMQALTRNQTIFICPGYIRTNSRFDNCSNWNNEKDNKFNSLAAFIQDRFTDKVIGTYESENDIYILALDTKSLNFAIKVYKSNNLENSDNAFDNPQYALLSKGELRIRKNSSVNNIGDSGFVSTIKVSSKQDSKICKIIKINVNGRPEICSQEDTSNKKSPNYKICSCNDIK